MAKKRIKRRKPLPTIGWREWLALPDLGIERIKVKVDTGARSSALHATELERFRRRGRSWVRFRVHPEQRTTRLEVIAEAPLADHRLVRSSSGKASLRPVIETTAQLGDFTWPVEVTLVNRDVMGFRMLLGRSAVRRRFLVDCGRSFRGARLAEDGRSKRPRSNGP